MNTAVLTGKKVVMPVRTVAVEEDGVVTDVSDYTDCSSTNEDVLKVGLRNVLLCVYASLEGDALVIMEMINTFPIYMKPSINWKYLFNFLSKADIIVLGDEGFTFQLQLGTKQTRKKKQTRLKIMAHHRLRPESQESH